MGYALGFAAKSIPESLDLLLRQRLAEQEMQRRQMEAEAEAAYREKMAAEAARRTDLEQQRFDFTKSDYDRRVAQEQSQEAERDRLIGAAQGIPNAAALPIFGLSAINTAMQRKFGPLGQQAQAEKAGLKVSPINPNWEQEAAMDAAAAARQHGYRMEEIDRTGLNQRRAAQAAAGRASEQVVPQIINRKVFDQKSGQEVWRVSAYDKLTGRVLWESDQPAGRVADQINRQAFIGTFQKGLPELKEWSKKINVSEGGLIDLTKQWAVNTYRGKAQPKEANWVAPYRARVRGMALMAARVMGSNSQLSDAEADRAEGLFPSISDSSDTAAKKWAYWDQIMQMPYEQARSIIRAELSALGVPLDRDLMMNPPSTMGPGGLPGSEYNVTVPTSPGAQDTGMQFLGFVDR